MRKLLIWLSVVCATLAAAAGPASRPNIVLIIADDLGCEDVGAFGHPAIRTPNLDRLAREGLRFDRAFVTASSCSPSRSSMITGRYPHSTDAEQLHWPLPAGQVTFVEKLRAAGYWTGAAGKWHLGDATKKKFDDVREADPAGFTLAAGAKSANDKISLAQTGDIQSGCTDWVPLLRARPRDRPFFAWLAALDPHRDYEETFHRSPRAPRPSWCLAICPIRWRCAASWRSTTTRSSGSTALSAWSSPNSKHRRSRTTPSSFS